MSEEEYTVPAGMLRALAEAFKKMQTGEILHLVMGEAAVRWLAKNPQTPTDEQLRELLKLATNNYTTNLNYIQLVTTWQRIMFLKKPNVPWEVEDLSLELCAALTNRPEECNEIERVITEAFHRGQKAGK